MSTPPPRASRRSRASRRAPRSCVKAKQKVRQRRPRRPRRRPRRRRRRSSRDAAALLADAAPHGRARLGAGAGARGSGIRRRRCGGLEAAFKRLAQSKPGAAAPKSAAVARRRATSAPGARAVARAEPRPPARRRQARAQAQNGARRRRRGRQPATDSDAESDTVMEWRPAGVAGARLHARAVRRRRRRRRRHRPRSRCPRRACPKAKSQRSQAETKVKARAGAGAGAQARARAGSPRPTENANGKRPCPIADQSRVVKQREMTETIEYLFTENDTVVQFKIPQPPPTSATYEIVYRYCQTRAHSASTTAQGLALLQRGAHRARREGAAPALAAAGAGPPRAPAAAPRPPWPVGPAPPRAWRGPKHLYGFYYSAPSPSGMDEPGSTTPSCIRPAGTEAHIQQAVTQDRGERGQPREQSSRAPMPRASP